jgi:short-subunit dehydrogenase
MFAERYGPWAVVIGAAQGIGAEFGRQLAARGLHLVLVALEEDLHKFAAELERDHGVLTQVIVGDITDPVTLSQLDTVTEKLEIGLLVYNAGLAVRGPWLDTRLERHLAMVDVNVRGPLRLIDWFVPAMASRGRGGVILLSSMSGLHGTPLLATYAASKAFLLNLAESLWEEWRPSGVDITALVPGSTDTPGYRASSPRATRLSPKPMPVTPVVAAALAALGARPWTIPGRTNRISGLVLSRLLPRRVTVRVMGATMRAMFGRTQD